MKLLITGASGYVGARLYQDLSQSFSVAGTYYSNALFKDQVRMDVTNPAEVMQVIGEQRPDVIIHAAAMPSGRFCEKHPHEARRINVEGTQNVVNAANKIGAMVILISTTIVAGNDVYAQTKHAAEELMNRCEEGFIILRPGLIIGASPNKNNDRPWNRLRNNIIAKTHAAYDTSWHTQITWIGHLSEAIEKLIDHGAKNEIISITTPEMKSRYDVAHDILKEFEIDVEAVEEETTYPTVISMPDKMHEFDIPLYSYEDVIEKCTEEMKEDMENGERTDSSRR